MTDPHTTTIAAISTPPGQGGVALIRLSGPQAAAIAQSIWRGPDIARMAPRTIAYGTIAHRGEDIDQAVITKFTAPHSYTGEDTIEITCHGSTYIQQAILKALIDAGATPAQPGEFTRRAYLSGRIDLAQAEGIADLIASRSQAAHRLALTQTKGTYSRALERVRIHMVTLASLLELELDFSEEDVEFADRSRLRSLTADIHRTVTSLADTYQAGNAIVNGIPVALAGIPNAGKSTLLNALIGHDRAIVSEIAGTTRDTIEDTLIIQGRQYRIIDTAGLRHTTDTIETLGIQRTDRAIRTAHIILYLTDPTAPLHEQTDRLRQIRQTLQPHQHLLHISTKADIAAPVDADIAISSTDPQSIDALRAMIAALQPDHTDTDIIVTNLRHYNALTRTADALERLRRGIDDGLSADLLAQDLREAISYLGEITGAVTSTDILTTIFSTFCIGK